MTECLISIINGKCFICIEQADYYMENISGHKNYNIYYYENPLTVFYTYIACKARATEC